MSEQVNPFKEWEDKGLVPANADTIQQLSKLWKPLKTTMRTQASIGSRTKRITVGDSKYGIFGTEEPEDQDYRNYYYYTREEAVARLARLPSGEFEIRKITILAKIEKV